MANKKNPTYTNKVFSVVDTEALEGSESRVRIYRAKHSSTVKRVVKQDTLEKLDARFQVQVLSSDEVSRLVNPKYIDVAPEKDVAPEDANQLDIEGAIKETEAQADADAGAGEEDQAEQAGEGHGAIFQ